MKAVIGPILLTGCRRQHPKFAAKIKGEYSAVWFCLESFHFSHKNSYPAGLGCLSNSMFLSALISKFPLGSEMVGIHKFGENHLFINQLFEQ